MATQQRNKTSQRRRTGKLKYFFLNGDLHRTLHINRGADEMIAWSYPQGRRVGYVYSDVKRRHGKAFTTAQVSVMLNRTRVRIQQALGAGSLREPAHTYPFSNHSIKYKYMWSEEDIIEAHEFFSHQHQGSPRKDGGITPKPIPTARELRAIIHQRPTLYIETEEGFVPTWEAEEF